MRKILFTLAVLGMMAGMSCGNGDMDEENPNEPKFYTVTYIKSNL